MKITKIAQILSGAALLMIGLSCGLAVFLALLPSEGLFDLLRMDSTEKTNVAFALMQLALILPIFFMEYGIFWIRKSRRMGDTQGRYPMSNIWTRIARVLLIIGLVFSLAIILGALLLIAAEVLLFGIALIGDSASLVRPLLIAGVILAVYAVFRISLWILWRVAGSKLADQISLGLAKYKLIDGGVEIDLNFAVQIGRPGPSRFCVRFDELEEVRRLTYAEAVTYMSFTVGPNIELGLREMRELYEWRTGRIPRPTAYIANAMSILGKKVLLRGPGLFFLVSFFAEDVGDLIDAFQRSMPSPIRAAGGLAATPSE